MRALTFGTTPSLIPVARDRETENGDMRLLIVDDNRQLAELTAELLRRMDRNARRIGTISLAGDLETAMRFLPHHDVVLCEGQFPSSPNFWYRDDQWTHVQTVAAERGIFFILYSGNPETLDAAQERGIALITKPSRIEHLYAVLMHHWQEISEASNPSAAALESSCVE